MGKLGTGPETLRKTCELEGCNEVFELTVHNRRYCSRLHKDRASQHRYSRPGQVFYEEVRELRHFSKLTDAGKKKILLGETDFTVVGFDLECTDLKGNIGRILCASFKPIGKEPYTFHALDKRFKRRDVHDDSALAVAIREELETYDVLVGWNSRLFDVKFLNARLIRAGEVVKKNQFHVDGMWNWRTKIRAWSGLNAVQQHILPEREQTKTAIRWEQWQRALGWDRKLREDAMDEIVLHCEIDVDVLEDVYRRLVSAGTVNNLKKDGGWL